jgi:hypothetical protein
LSPRRLKGRRGGNEADFNGAFRTDGDAIQHGPRISRNLFDRFGPEIPFEQVTQSHRVASPVL